MVVCAHCNCMAGLREACSHVAALLFLLDANSQVRKSLSCTSLPCYWLPPTFKSVPFARICDIDFTAPQRKHKKVLDQATPASSSSATIPSTTVSSNVKPSADDLDGLYKTLSTGKAAILSLIPGYCRVSYLPSQGSYRTLGQSCQSIPCWTTSNAT